MVFEQVGALIASSLMDLYHAPIKIIHPNPMGDTLITTTAPLAAR